MDASDPQSYVLSADESEAIFERDIVPAELGALLLPADQQPNDASTNSNNAAPRTPLAVLLIGQTGAGKSRTAPAIKQAMEHLRGPARLAHFVADTYKTYHPAYRALLARNPALASPATAPDARRWLATAAARAAAARADVLLESAARHPADFAQLAALFRGAGYRVEAAVLAVPAALSRLGVLARFYGGLGQGGGLPVRLTPRAVHDASYAGLLEAAAFVDASDAVDQVVVVRRDGMVAYVNERAGRVGSGGGSSSSSWRREAGVAAAVRAERERPLTLVEKTGAESSLRELRDTNVPSLESQLVEIEGLLEPLMGDLDQSAYAPLRPLSLPSSAQDESFDVEAGLRLGVISS
ncbi:zeta toxin-domain-containing protein [Hypoxylon rubiginosum]|uniref:Zeta toxin-domain-containing protein n=1 Tax=Hypoxylon rubiginosum TaxID=110542 RepID=A0ACB9Z5Y2_9PEZI|nr:zeta toxin-domain-containing protein [Hypoxylon rubiginosum]